RERLQKQAKSRCFSGYSYRAMCRFGSGPIFWLDVMKDLDYFIRFDEDANVTASVTSDLVTDLQNIDGGYGYILEQTSSSQCRVGLNKVIVDFINEVNHESYGRPWIRLSDFRMFNQMPANPHDILNVSAIVKEPVISIGDPAQGSLAFNR